MTWRSTTAALITWARYRLDGRPLRSTSDFGGTGGGAPHERGAQITDGYDRVVEVERAVLATFHPPHHRLVAIPVDVCRRIFLALTVGKRLAKKIDPKRRGRDAEAAAGWKHDPGMALVLAVQDWRQAADDASLDEQLVALIVRVGHAQVTEALAARGLVPARRRQEEPMATSKLALKQARDPDRLNGWKEIARFLGVSARTARRWARAMTDALPVHRTLGGWPWSRKSEIRAWEKARSEIAGTARTG